VLAFVWLGIGGGLYVIFGAQAAGPRYDAALHAIFIGFVMSMIFGHAPVIFPAVLGVAINVRSGFYFQLLLLHGSLVLRILADYANWHILRMWSGLLNVIAILLFIARVASSVRRGHPGK